MIIDPKDIYGLVERIRLSKPLIHSITNYVVTNQNANMLLALGASPIISHCPEELQEIASKSQALSINIGTLDWIDSIRIACREAHKANIPVILDPVGSGFTKIRTKISRELIESGYVSVVRCNASEAISLIDDSTQGHGVDSSISSDDMDKYIHQLKAEVAIRYNITLSISGQEDFIISPKHIYSAKNGHPIMSRVTGMGCSASSIVAACASVSRDNLPLAALGAMIIMGICGERAVSHSMGPGSFQVNFFDELYNLNFETIRSSMRATHV